MKRLFVFLVVLFSLNLAGCMSDMDAFGESNYNTFRDIHFVNQDGSSAIYESEHLIKVTMLAAEDDEDWEYAVLDYISISSLATLHVVDGKFAEFPSDSLALDSLANEISYSKESLKSGSKIRIPASNKVYLMVVSESGIPAIWQLTFVIPEKENSSCSSGEKNSSSSMSSSSSKQVESSSSLSSSSLSSAKNLQIVFENQMKQNLRGDSIFVKLNAGESVDEVKLKSMVISDGANISPNPEAVKSWKEPQTFKVTAEDGSEKKWVVVVSVAEADEKPASHDKNLISIGADGETSKANIDSVNRLVTLHLPSKAAATEASILIEIPPTASHDLPLKNVNLLDTVSFVITAEDLSSDEWKLIAEFPILNPVAPRILSMKIDGHEAVIDSVEENGSMVFWIHYDHLEFLADLTNLSVSDIVLTEDAEVSGVADGEKYDLEKGIVVTVKNSDDESLRYEIRAGYQYPSMNIGSSDWTKDDNGNLYDLKGWDNGNNSFTKELAVSAESGDVLKMQTTKYAGKIASGNTFTAYFNPKNVNAISMLSYKDGNELIDFGRPFYGRPRYVEFDAKYEGKGDSCDLYLLLESRMTASGEVRTAEDGKNQYRSSSDVNTLVASAWFRATTVDSDDDPDVVSIHDAAREGFKTIRMKLSYGIPLENSPLYQSSVFASGLKNSAGIDNHLEKTDSPDDFKVTHIRIVMASSANGNVYEGEKDAILLVDGIRLIY